MKLPISSKIYHGMYERILPCETAHVSAGFCFGIEREFEEDNISSKRKETLVSCKKRGSFKRVDGAQMGVQKKAINI